jgi:hypothetical protein
MTDFNVRVTKNDVILCDCGCDIFAQPLQLFKVKSPLIGKPDIVVTQPLRDLPLACGACGKEVTKNLKSKSEIEKEKETKLILS